MNVCTTHPIITDDYPRVLPLRDWIFPAPVPRVRGARVVASPRSSNRATTRVASMMSSILSTSTTSAARAVAAAAVRLSTRRGGVRLRGGVIRIGHKASTPRHEATRIVFGAGVCGWGLPRRLSSSSRSIVVLASKTNEWRGPRDGGGKWTKKKKKKTATDGGGGGGKGWRNGGGRGGGGGGVGDAPVKRRPRQFTDAQLEAIAALQAVADAGTVPTCALYKGKANIFLDGNPIVYGRACVDGTLTWSVSVEKRLVPSCARR